MTCTLHVHLSHVQVHMQVSVNNKVQLPFLQIYARSYCLSFFASAYFIFTLTPAFFAVMLVIFLFVPNILYAPCFSQTLSLKLFCMILIHILTDNKNADSLDLNHIQITQITSRI